MTPPLYLFLSINEVCNLRCQHCEYWRSKRSPQQSLTRQREIITEFAEIGGQSVVICGGEPTLERASYFDVCMWSHEKNLRVLSVINGSTVDEEMAKNLLQYGPDEISISLDGADAETHDRIRGRSCSFEKATSALRLLLRERGKGDYPKIYAMGLLGASTYRKLDEWYNLVLCEIGADKLKLNSLQPTFLHTRIGQDVVADEFFAAESQVDVDVLLRNLLACRAKYGLALNPEWVTQVVSYFQHLQGRPNLKDGWKACLETPLHLCNTGERNIMVDVQGYARLCFSNNFRGEKLEKPGDLKAFWEGAEDVREKMRTCRQLCGISHSVRRAPATLKRP